MAERTPTPRIKDNLPPPDDRDDSGGHEVPSKPIEWYERANPRTQGDGSYVPGQWAPLPEPPEADIPKLNELHARNPEWYPKYNKGGRVQKHGSDTCIVCKDKFS